MSQLLFDSRHALAVVFGFSAVKHFSVHVVTYLSSVCKHFVFVSFHREVAHKLSCEKLTIHVSILNWLFNDAFKATTGHFASVSLCLQGKPPGSAEPDVNLRPQLGH